MQFLVKIDRASVRDNPNAGRTHYMEHVGQTAHMIFPWPDKELPDNFKPFARLIEARQDRLSLTFKPGEKAQEVRSFILTAIMESIPENLQQLADANFIPRDYFQVTVNNHIQEYHSMVPEPAQFFEYEKTSVECCNCHAKFPYTDLKTDSIPDYGCEYADEYYSDRVCPKCNEFDCCELDFERL
jgi:hypothetical protein